MSISMTSNMSKWWMTMKVSWTKHTAYRLNFFLQVIGPALVFFFIKYNLWSAIYGGDTTLSLKGFTFEGMITYHAWALIVSLIAQGHTAMNMGEDIRMGRISTYLIYPFNFWEFHTASFLSFQLLQMMISSLTIFLIVIFGVIQAPSTEMLFNGYSYCLFVSFFWYALQYFTGLLAFWLEETWILRVILSIVVAFLSGAIIPLDLFPSWLVSILDRTPFPYLTYVPIKMFMGTYETFAKAYLTIGIWTVFFAVLNHFTWRRGVRLYTAAGM